MSPATPVVADTHVVWWYLRRPEKLSTLAREHLAAATESGLPILVSSVIELEFIWLAKNGRITQHVRETMTAELNAGPPFQEVPITRAVLHAAEAVSTASFAEPADRIHAGTARLLGVPLISKDGQIRQWHGVTVIW